MTPKSEMAVDSSDEGISVGGFVKAPRRYSYRQGMTIEEALDLAGGYGACESCQAFWEETRRHATFNSPPKVKRGGRRLDLPKRRSEWSQFKLQPGDEIEFRHFDY